MAKPSMIMLRMRLLCLATLMAFSSLGCSSDNSIEFAEEPAPLPKSEPKVMTDTEGETPKIPRRRPS